MDDKPTQEILKATYRALCEHGYADLTLNDIATEANKSTALIHYYYDSKDQLFVAFLDFLSDQHANQLESIHGKTPRERLYSLLETLLTDHDETPITEFRTAVLEVKAQAPYNNGIQAQLAESDEYLFEHFREIITTGIDTGDFDTGVDPELAAEFLTTTIKGAHTRQVAVDHSIDQLHEAVRRYVEIHLLADDASKVRH